MKTLALAHPMHANGRQTLIIALAVYLFSSASLPSQSAALAQITSPAVGAPVTQPLFFGPPIAPGTGPAAQWLDLTYADTSSAQKLDLYRPAGGGSFPVVVYVHGGGFRKGDKSQPKQSGIVDALLSRGYAVASLNYRLSGEAKFPSQIQDVKTAVRWLRAHAPDYGLDPLRFGAWGDSAGANLVSLLGTSCGVADLEGSDLGNADQSSCVQAVIDFYAPIDFLTMDQEFVGTTCPQTHDLPTSPESEYIGGPIQQYPELVKAANPITYVTADDPPFFVEHGTEDCTVPFQQSQGLYDALKLVIGANNVQLKFLQGAGHGGAEFVKKSNLMRVFAFLDRHLK